MFTGIVEGVGKVESLGNGTAFAEVSEDKQTETKADRKKFKMG